ncbi:hypothetical protein L3X38_002803 [Prunus dulcis]|uniref:NB-ARC domain-containing protein n=1 Tax=Prunus dulcis TaxID=3755 RepID=A0AAD4ZKC5_PRUDU|nr:hypothetical protein L3X38_002803 [Prunus dulcis]
MAPWVPVAAPSPHWPCRRNPDVVNGSSCRKSSETRPVFPEIQTSRSLSSDHQFRQSWNQSESKFIQNIIEEISKHVLNCVPLEVAEHPVGMQPQIQVMNKLLDLRENDVRMIGVWGTGGIGKTTIAKIQLPTNLKVNVDKGVTMIKEWLRRRKAVELDDGVNLIHEVKILDDDKALELFCWHAFKTSEPPLGDYVKLAEHAIRHAQGLPLALKVLGSCLCGGDMDKWKALLEGFKSPKIQDWMILSRRFSLTSHVSLRVKVETM